MAGQLKAQGLSLKRQGMWWDAYAALSKYQNLVGSMQRHNAAHQPQYKSRLQNMNYDVSAIRRDINDILPKLKSNPPPSSHQQPKPSAPGKSLYPSLDFDGPPKQSFDSYLSLGAGSATAPPNLGMSSASAPQSLRPMEVPEDLINNFIAMSERNTDLNKETCAFLCGELQRGVYKVTGFIIPKQTGSSDQCECLNEMEVFEVLQNKGSMILGWIHTHPRHALMLSAVDLHTHSNYQALLPEAIAIVYAPGERQTLGIFRLTASGMREVQSCQQSGFHPHSQNSYQQVNDVRVIQGNVPYEVIDLR